MRCTLCETEADYAVSAPGHRNLVIAACCACWKRHLAGKRSYLPAGILQHLIRTRTPAIAKDAGTGEVFAFSTRRAGFLSAVGDRTHERCPPSSL